jgi:hypothetical protein
MWEQGNPKSEGIDGWAIATMLNNSEFKSEIFQTVPNTIQTRSNLVGSKQIFPNLNILE